MYLFLLLVLSSILIFPQDRGWNNSEIFMITRGLNPSETIRYKMIAIGSVWDKSKIDNSYFLSQNLNEAYYPPLVQLEAENTIEGSSIYLVGGFNMKATYK
jgi:hypothetical protein